MKLIAKFSTLFLTSALLATALGADPVSTFVAAFTASSVLAFFGFGPETALYNTTVNIGEMADELKKLFVTKPGLPGKWFFSDEVMIRKYAQRIAKIKGDYHVPMWLLSSVVQGFKDEWTPFGKLYIKAKTLTDYHLKINLAIKPTEILASYLGATAYEENKALADRPISQYIADMIGETAVEDMDILSIDGEYDEDLMNSEFGYSMKGLIRVLLDQVTTTLGGDADHPMFIIPSDKEMDTANPDNIVEVVREFERSIPKRFRNRVDTIFLERFWYDEYQDQYRALHGGDTLIKDGDLTRTYGGRMLQPIDSDKMGNLIFATTKNNIIDMIDMNEIPAIHDIQTQDYTVKLLGEGRGGFDFAINQAVFVRSEETDKLGLHNDEQNGLLFKINETSGSGSAS